VSFIWPIDTLQNHNKDQKVVRPPVAKHAEHAKTKGNSSRNVDCYEKTTLNALLEYLNLLFKKSHYLKSDLANQQDQLLQSTSAQ